MFNLNRVWQRLNDVSTAHPSSRKRALSHFLRVLQAASITYLLSSPTSAALAETDENRAGFKLHPPASWVRVEENDGPFEIYTLKNSRSEQTVTFEKLNIPAGQSGFDYLASQRLGIQNERAKLFAAFGLKDYVIREVKERTEKNHRFQILASEYRNLFGKSVQIIERQYPVGGVVYRMSYSEVAFKSVDMNRADKIFDSFQAELPRNDREPAAEAVGANSAPLTEIPKDGEGSPQRDFWNQFGEKFGTRASEEFCKDVPEADRWTTDDDKNWAERITMGGVDCLKRLGVGFFGMIEAAARLVVSAKYQAQVKGAISNLASDYWHSKDSTPVWAFNKISQGIAGNFPKFQCYSFEKRIGMVCNVTTNTVMTLKLMANLGLTLAEKTSLNALIKKGTIATKNGKAWAVEKWNGPKELPNSGEMPIAEKQGRHLPKEPAKAPDFGVGPNPNRANFGVGPKRGSPQLGPAIKRSPEFSDLSRNLRSKGAAVNESLLAEIEKLGEIPPNLPAAELNRFLKNIEALEAAGKGEAASRYVRVLRQYPERLPELLSMMEKHTPSLAVAPPPAPVPGGPPKWRHELKDTFKGTVGDSYVDSVLDPELKAMSSATVPGGKTLQYPNLAKNWKVVQADREAMKLARDLARRDPDALLQLLNDKFPTKYLRTSTEAFKQAANKYLTGQAATGEAVTAAAATTATTTATTSAAPEVAPAATTAGAPQPPAAPKWPENLRNALQPDVSPLTTQGILNEQIVKIGAEPAASGSGLKYPYLAKNWSAVAKDADSLDVALGLARENPDEFLRLLADKNTSSPKAFKAIAQKILASEAPKWKVSPFKGEADAYVNSHLDSEINAIANTKIAGGKVTQYPNIAKNWKLVKADPEAMALARDIARRDPDTLLSMLNEEFPSGFRRKPQEAFKQWARSFLEPEAPPANAAAPAVESAGKSTASSAPTSGSVENPAPAAPATSAKSAMDLKNSLNGVTDAGVTRALVEAKIQELAADSGAHPDLAAKWKIANGDRKAADLIARLAHKDPELLIQLVNERVKLNGLNKTGEFKAALNEALKPPPPPPPAPRAPVDLKAGLNGVTDAEVTRALVKNKLDELAANAATHPNLAAKWQTLLGDVKSKELVAQLAHKDPDLLIKLINEKVKTKGFGRTNAFNVAAEEALKPATATTATAVSDSAAPKWNPATKAVFKGELAPSTVDSIIENEIKVLGAEKLADGKSLKFPTLDKNWELVKKDPLAMDLARQVAAKDPDQLLSLLNEKFGTKRLGLKTSTESFKKGAQNFLDPKPVDAAPAVQATAPAAGSGAKLPDWKDGPLNLGEGLRTLDNVAANDVITLSIQTYANKHRGGAGLLNAWEQISRSPKARSAGIELAKYDQNLFFETLGRNARRGNIPFASKAAQRMRFTIDARRVLDEKVRGPNPRTHGLVRKIEDFGSDVKRALTPAAKAPEEVFKELKYSYGNQIKLNGGYQHVKSPKIALTKLNEAITATRDEALQAQWKSLRWNSQALRRATSLAKRDPDLVAKFLAEASETKTFGAKKYVVPKKFIALVDEYAAKHNIPIDPYDSKIGRLVNMYTNTKVGQVVHALSIPFQGEETEEPIGPEDGPESPIGTDKGNGTLTPDQIIAPNVDSGRANNNGIAPSVNNVPGGESLGQPLGAPFESPSSGSGPPAGPSTDPPSGARPNSLRRDQPSPDEESGSRLSDGGAGLAAGAAVMGAIAASGRSSKSQPQTLPAPSAPSASGGSLFAESNTNQDPPPRPAHVSQGNPQLRSSHRSSSSARSSSQAGRDTRDDDAGDSQIADASEPKKSGRRSGDEIRKANASESKIFKTASQRIKSRKGLEAQLERLAAVPGGNHPSIAQTYRQLTDQKNGRALADRLAARARKGDFREVVRFLESHKNIKPAKLSKKHIHDLVDRFDSHEDGHRRPKAKHPHKKAKKKKHKSRRKKSPNTLDGEEPSDAGDGGDFGDDGGED